MGRSYSALVCLRDSRRREGAVDPADRRYWPFEERLSESTFLPERREVWQFPWANLLVGQHWDAAGVTIAGRPDERGENERGVAARPGLIHRPRTPGGPMNYTSDSLSGSLIWRLFLRDISRGADERHDEDEEVGGESLLSSMKKRDERGETRTRARVIWACTSPRLSGCGNEWPSNKRWQLKLDTGSDTFSFIIPRCAFVGGAHDW